MCHVGATTRSAGMCIRLARLVRGGSQWLPGTSCRPCVAKAPPPRPTQAGATAADALGLGISARLDGPVRARTSDV